jgi:hypothetical protein
METLRKTDLLVLHLIVEYDKNYEISVAYTQVIRAVYRQTAVDLGITYAIY